MDLWLSLVIYDYIKFLWTIARPDKVLLDQQGKNREIDTRKGTEDKENMIKEWMCRVNFC